LDDERVLSALRRSHIESLRARILALLDDCYPQQMHTDILYWQLSRKGIDTCINDVVREVHYLRDKDIVNLECIVADRFLVTITAKGRDVVAGAVEEVGIMPIDLSGD
jgi:hypothetical protein